MQRFFYEKSSPILWGGDRVEWGIRHYALSSYLSPFLKVSSLTFEVQTMAFQAKLPSKCVFKVFKVIQYSYEIFQTVLNLNCQNHLAI